VGHFEEKGVDGRIILKWTFRKLVERGMDQIDLAQDRYRLRTVQAAVMKLLGT